MHSVIVEGFFIIYFLTQCVKALVFADKVRTRINVNAQNSRGDTPLHLASKWGYGEISIHVFTNIMFIVFWITVWLFYVFTELLNLLKDVTKFTVKYNKCFVESIIQTLLDSNARTDIKNRKKQSPSSIAQNALIQRMFQQYDSMPTIVTERHKSQVSVTYLKQ